MALGSKEDLAYTKQKTVHCGQPALCRNNRDIMANNPEVKLAFLHLLCDRTSNC